MAMDEPQEDEFALNCLTQMSVVLSWTFPRRASHYDRFLTFRECSRGGDCPLASEPCAGSCRS